MFNINISKENIDSKLEKIKRMAKKDIAFRKALLDMLKQIEEDEQCDNKECVIRSKVLSATTKKKAKGEGFTDRYDQFLNLLLYFKADDDGEVMIPLEELMSGIGLKISSPDMVERAKEMIATNAWGSEREMLPIHIKIYQVDEWKKGGYLRANIAKHSPPYCGSFVKINRTTFNQIIRAAKENHACAAYLLEFYLYFLTAMGKYELGNKVLHCCALTRDKILTDLQIGWVSICKYRKILSECGLLYYFVGGKKVATGYALEDDSQAYMLALKSWQINGMKKVNIALALDNAREFRIAQKEKEQGNASSGRTTEEIIARQEEQIIRKIEWGMGEYGISDL